MIAVGPRRHRQGRLPPAAGAGRHGHAGRHGRPGQTARRRRRDHRTPRPEGRRAAARRAGGRRALARQRGHRRAPAGHRHRHRLQRHHPLAAQKILPAGIARPRAHRAPGLVHVRHGRNVTAFNTVWTYDLYQAYLAPNKPDAHYVLMGKIVTFVGIGLSIACAFVAKEFPNAMDIVQLVFGFVNAPLFATFLLGMFWTRTTSHGAFYGLVGGTLTSALFHGTTIATGNSPGVKGAWITSLQIFPARWRKTSGWPASPSSVAWCSLWSFPWPPPAPRPTRS
ncbi:MAG: hypothetical protein WDO13_07355 [Verrucomicrobiota bacterium]